MARTHSLPGIIFSLLLDHSGSMMAEYFRTVVHFDDFRFDVNVLDVVETPSFFNCALECFLSDACLSFQYNARVPECRLLDVIYLSRYTAVESSGWRYFEKKGGYCPPDFTPYGAERLCFRYVGYMDRQSGEEHCHRLGVGLIPVISQSINDLVVRMLEPIEPSGEGARSCYIQGSFNSSHWVLDDGQELTYNNWATGQPRNQFSSLTIRISNQKHYWHTCETTSQKVRIIFCGFIAS